MWRACWWEPVVGQAVLGLMLLACAAVFVGVKRYRCFGRAKGGRRYGHYRMVGVTGSAPASDEL